MHFRISKSFDKAAVHLMSSKSERLAAKNSDNLSTIHWKLKVVELFIVKLNKSLKCKKYVGSDLSFKIFSQQLGLRNIFGELDNFMFWSCYCVQLQIQS